MGHSAVLKVYQEALLVRVGVAPEKHTKSEQVWYASFDVVKGVKREHTVFVLVLVGQAFVHELLRRRATRYGVADSLQHG